MEAPGGLCLHILSSEDARVSLIPISSLQPFELPIYRMAVDAGLSDVDS
jgi:hypothetical protein